MDAETRVDVLEVLDQAIQREKEAGQAYVAQVAARAAVVELIESAIMVNGDHASPHDCYATGPLTGNDYLDLIVCPGCRLNAALSTIRSTV